MNRRGVLLFPAALGISAAAHLLLLFLWPYSPARPGEQRSEPIPVRLMEAPRPAQRPAPPPPAAPRRQAAPPEPASPAPVQSLPSSPPPAPQAEPEPQPEVAESPLELAPPVTTSGEALQHPTAPEPAAAGSQAGSGSDTSAALAAEISATQAVLSSLRARILAKIRYPPLARANGWKGTVLLELLLDERGALQALAVRRSSGYAVLDRAATTLVRAVTPVNNPLGRPLRIEVPISYELQE